MKTVQRVHVVVLACLAALGTVVYAQYGVSSVEHPEKAEFATNAYEEERGLKGEWIESAGKALLVSSADENDSRPQAYPYFYLSRNWKRCVEFTAESPEGRPCSSTFQTMLKNAEVFLLKE